MKHRGKNNRLKDVDEFQEESSSGRAAQAHITPAPLIADVDARPIAAVPGAKEPRLVTESISQILWNDAYDSLENDEDTEKLVGDYVKTLAIALKEEAIDISASTVDISAQLRDRTKRQ